MNYDLCRDVACHVFTFCHPDDRREEGSVIIAQPEVGVTEILRFTLDDNLLFLKLLKGLKGVIPQHVSFSLGSLETILPL